MNHMANKVQLYLLDMVKDLHEICLKNGIEYYIIGGTFLGAVRHKGFIPWDDDIDVGMPRKSYEKFLELPDSAMPDYLFRGNTGYKKNEGDFLYTKLYNRNTTLIENINEKRIGGIYIDVFPIDGAHNIKLLSKLKYYYSRIFIYGIWLNASKVKRKNPIKQIIQISASKFNNRKIYKKANALLSRTPYENSKYVGNFMGNWGIKEVMPKDFFGEPTLYKFNDIKLYGPEKSHEFLSAVYGDYMELPPIEKQKSHHVYEYINLEQGYEEYYKEKLIRK